MKRRRMPGRVQCGSFALTSGQADVLDTLTRAARPARDGWTTLELVEYLGWTDWNVRDRLRRLCGYGWTRRQSACIDRQRRNVYTLTPEGKRVVQRCRLLRPRWFHYAHKEARRVEA